MSSHYVATRLFQVRIMIKIKNKKAYVILFKDKKLTIL